MISVETFELVYSLAMGVALPLFGLVILPAVIFYLESRRP